MSCPRRPSGRTSGTRPRPGWRPHPRGRPCQSGVVRRRARHIGVCGGRYRAGLRRAASNRSSRGGEGPGLVRRHRVAGSVLHTGGPLDRGRVRRTRRQIRSPGPTSQPGSCCLRHRRPHRRRRPAAVNVNVLDEIEAAFIASENVPVTFAVTATPVWALVGDVVATVGGVVSPEGRGVVPPAPPVRVVVVPVPACGVHVGEHQQAAVGRARRITVQILLGRVTLWTYWSASTIRAVFAVVKLMLFSGVDFS
jgi:hypothetical protein